MMFVTHLAAGLLASLVLVSFLEPVNPVVFIMIMCIAAVLPDIDCSRSKVGRKVRVLSKVLQFLFGHRGLLHTVYVPLFGLVLCVFLGFPTVGFAFLLGYMVHILTDALTKEGVRMFAPLLRLELRGLVRTGGFTEYIFLALVVVGLGYKVLFLAKII